MTGRDLRRPSGVSHMVVKLGTTTVTAGAGDPAHARLLAITEQIAELRRREVSVVLVSSGAIAAGMAPLGLARRPTDMPTLQAAAAVGQRRLMDLYAELLEPHGIPVAQVLLTQDDFVKRRHYVNARNTLQRLMELRAVPIVNENDTVAVEEIRYGDNDLLAALVANMAHAGLLVMLSDVEGVFSTDPRRPGAVLLPVLEDITPELLRAARRAGSPLGSGGMASKLEAARIATLSGVGAVIASGERANVLLDIHEGAEVGTYFPPASRRTAARKLWIAWALPSRGKVLVDEGAKSALVHGNKSLLGAGIRSIEGAFQAGDAVEVVGPDGRAFAKGLVSFDSDVLAELAGAKGGREVIHRDHLVVL